MKTVPFLRVVILVGGCALAGWNGARAAEETHIRNLSPGKHFALRTHEKRETGTVTYEDAEVIALPSQQVLMKLDLAGDKPAPDLVWSPDAKRFAFYQDDGLRYGLPRVYEFADGASREMKVPDVGPDENDLPEKAHQDSVYVNPERWLDANTLLVHYSWRAVAPKGDGEEMVKGEVRYQIRFTKDGQAVVSLKGKLKFTHGS